MSIEESILHPVAIAQVMINFAARYGVDGDTCLAGTGISESQLQDPNALIRREQEMRLVENLMLALPDTPALGFELGLQYNVATFGIWGFALRTSRTLREVVHRALRYLPLSTAYCRFQEARTADEYALEMDPGAIPLPLRQFFLERDMATALNLLHELSLAGLSVKRIEFAGAAADHVDRLAVLSPIAPVYGAGRNAIVLRAQDADLPLPMYDAHMVRLLEDQCRLQLERRQLVGLSGRVRQHLLGELGLVASIEDMAVALSMSPRSLRRKLEEEGTNYRALVEDERRQLAHHLLRETDMKLEEMALQLGYTDTASFTRAFRRWFSMAPGEYRRAGPLSAGT